MAPVVTDALARAAERSKRRAELETAKVIIERGLGYELPDDHQFQWISVLSMPYMKTDWIGVVNTIL